MGAVDGREREGGMKIGKLFVKHNSCAHRDLSFSYFKSKCISVILCFCSNQLTL